MISEEDKEKVKQLRLSGMSYKDVAKQLGYSRDEVRNYCKKIPELYGRKDFSNCNSDDKIQCSISNINPHIKYISGYTKVKEKVHVKCLVCGYEFDRVYMYLTQRYAPCPECKHKETEKQKIKTQELKEKERKEFKAHREQKRQVEKERQEREKIELNTFTCKECGKKFIHIKQGKKKFCSNECARKNAHRKRIPKEKRISKDKIIDKDITLMSLYKRDMGVCYLCGEKCDYSDYVIRNGTVICGDWYPSIDHIVPVSKGGEHSWKNVKLAHRRCNYLKRDRI